MAVRRITAAAAVAAVLCAGVAGCGGDASSADPTPTVTASASASPSPTGPAAPVLPELAKRNDAVGAKAFLRYWFAAVTYAMKTGDTEPFMAVSAKECKTCDGLATHIEGLEQDGLALIGGGWQVLGVEHDPKTEAPYFRFAVKVRQLKQRIVNEHEKEVDQSRASVFFFYVGVSWEDEAFELSGVERVGD